MSSLSEMPELVMENIIGFLDFRSVLTLRQVCRDFRNFIDDLNHSKLPDSGFLNIYMEVNQNFRIYYEDPYRIRHEFVYSESDNSRRFNGKTTPLENSNLVDVAIRDLGLVLKFQKSTLIWSCFDIVHRRLSNHYSSFQIILSNMFKKLNRKIKTKNLSITTDSQSGFMSILPFFDSEPLTILYLHSVNDKMQIKTDELVKTEQWKNPKRINFDFYASNMTVEDICNVSEFYGKMLHISTRDLDLLKKTFTTSIKSVSWDLHIRNFNRNEEISNLWGPAFIRESSSCWYFRIKDSNVECLKLELRDNTFNFDFIKLNDVPHGAVVHDYNEN